jgi:hypothetical protein
MATKNITVDQGKSFALVLRWETEPIIYKAISGITQSAPVIIHAPAHGIPDGWRCAVTNVKGMTEINGQANELKATDYHTATVVDADHIEFNDVNAAGFKPYASGGHVQYNTPVDLVGFAARLQVKDKVGGTLLFTMTTENGRIEIDTAARTITLKITAEDTAALLWKKGVFELEMVSATGDVAGILSGTIVVTREVVT